METSRVNNLLHDYVPFQSTQSPVTRCTTLDVGDPTMTNDFHPHFASTVGKRYRETGGIDVAILRRPCATQHTIG